MRKNKTSTREQRRDKKQDKKQKKSSMRKYGQTQLKHSKMGVYSCWYAAAALVIVLAAISLAYIRHGEAAGIIGGMGILAIVLAILGIHASVIGRRERERNYITCRIGTVANVVELLFLILIFIGGIH